LSSSFKINPKEVFPASYAKFASSTKIFVGSFQDKIRFSSRSVLIVKTSPSDPFSIVFNFVSIESQ